MFEAIAQKAVFEVIRHPIFKKIKGREIDLIYRDGALNGAAFDNSQQILEGRMGLLLTTEAINLPYDQLQALIAHELAHHLHGDYRPSFWLFFTTGAFSACALGVLITSGLVLALLTFAVGIIATGIVRSHFSRLKEYRADWIAAKVVGPEATLALLSNLDVDKMEPIDRIMGIWATHPTPQKRKKKIKKFFWGDF